MRNSRARRTGAGAAVTAALLAAAAVGGMPATAGAQEPTGTVIFRGQRCKKQDLTPSSFVAQRRRRLDLQAAERGDGR